MQLVVVLSSSCSIGTSPPGTTQAWGASGGITTTGGSFGGATSNPASTDTGNVDADSGGSGDPLGSTTGAGGNDVNLPSIDPSDPHRFLLGNEPWYPVGYYPGAALNMTGPGYAGDFTAYNYDLIDKLAEHQIDLFRVWVNWGNLGKGVTWDAHIHHPYLRTGPGVAFDGQPKLDLDQFDPAYFDLIEDAIEYAADRGIVVQVMILDCWHAGFGLNNGFAPLDYFAGGNNVNGVDFTTHQQWIDTRGEPFARSRAFAERLVDEIGEHPNIIWETCNEKQAGDHSTPTATATDPFHATLATAIHDREDVNGYDRHLVMPVDLPEHRTVAGHRTPANGAGNEESISAMHDRLAGEQWGWATPLISDNDCCVGEPAAAFIRHKAWAALTAGAHVDVFNNELFRPEVLSNANTANGMRFVGYVGQFIRDREIDLRGMTPLDRLVEGDATIFGRTEDALIVYTPSGGSFTLLSMPSNATTTWFDPRSGNSMPASGGPVFTAPTVDDWVLYVAVDGA